MEFTHTFYDALPPEAAAIRQAVFVEEQGFQEEFDAIDRHALHLLLFADGRPVGTLRAFTEDGGTRWHIGRVAVRALRCLPSAGYSLFTKSVVLPRWGRSIWTSFAPTFVWLRNCNKKTASSGNYRRLF